MIDMELMRGVSVHWAFHALNVLSTVSQTMEKNKNSRMFKAVPGQNYVFDDRKLLPIVDINIK